MADSQEVADVTPGFLDFLNYAWTPFHAVDKASELLIGAGYKKLSEDTAWKILPGDKYFFTRNMSTLVAFAVGEKYAAGNGAVIIGAHTDSPCPKLKPISKVERAGCRLVGVETYGGGLWHTWFDRDLSVAGRVLVRQSDGSVAHKLVKITRPIMRIPTLAIHLDRGVSDGFKVNTQQHLVPLLATTLQDELNKPSSGADSTGTADSSKSAPSPPASEERHHTILLELLAKELNCSPADICDFELNVCDTQPSVVGGARDEFVFSGRLDNLCSSYCALKALVDTDSSLAEESAVRIVALFDHEEVGSSSAQGAGSPVMRDTLVRLAASMHDNAMQQTLLEEMLQKSFLVSADMAHAVHPNYQDKHEESHRPKFNGGLVIKQNANQRYSTNALSAFFIRETARRHKLPVQDFVVRNDMACGSTIGPILTSGLGVRGVDVGTPQLSMHSIREVCGARDVAYTMSHFKAVFEEFSSLAPQLRVDSQA